MRSNFIYLNSFIYLIVLAFSNSLESQISIPYGNDVMNEFGSRWEADPDGRSWPCRFITYFFVNGTSDISGSNEHEAVRRAFNTWAAVTNLDFIETCTESQADIRILWGTHAHGDPCEPPSGCWFDGIGGDLAHAWFPPPHLNLFAGDVHFDDDEFWTLNATAGGNSRDLETVALHEIGHSLGLAHSLVNNAVMEGTYEGARRALTTDDIAGIRSIYESRMHPIDGEDFTCATYYQDYSAGCSNQNTSLNWSVPYGLHIETGQGTPDITVRQSTQHCSEGEIKLEVTTDCDQRTFTRWVSYCCAPAHKPYDVYIRNDLLNCCYNFAVIPWDNCRKQFHWFVNGQEFYTYDIYLNQCFDYRITNYYISVAAINDCGESEFLHKYMFAQPICRSPIIEIYPNPASSFIHIEIDTETDLQMDYSISIHDWTGRNLYSAKLDCGESKVDIEHLPSGHYYAVLKGNDIQEIKRFVVQNSLNQYNLED